MPGGVSSPVRAFKAVGGAPVFVDRGAGAHVFDADGNRYADYIMSYGPLIAGHAPPHVVAAMHTQITRGTAFGMPGKLEADLASVIRDAMPAMEMIRFVNSGTEAAMSAVRLARAATGRDVVIKCTGCYHGHVDALLVDAGSGALTHGVPSSPGVPESITRNTHVVPYNDLPAARRAMESCRGRVACFAVEPIAGNMGLIKPAGGYLAGLRALCDEFGALLLFDEVMTGFRVARGGATQLSGVKPDMTCLAKIIGGGVPVGAYGGPAHVMSMVSPQGPVYQAGTLSGNPLAMTAGLATLALLDPAAYATLEARSDQLACGLRQAARNESCPITVNRVGSMLTVFFTTAPDTPIHTYASATACDTNRFARFFHGLLDRGVMIPPSQFECWFVSLAHDEQTIQETIDAAAHGFRAARA